MPCYYPLRAYYGKNVQSSGKRAIVFKPGLAWDRSEKLDLPCGRCIGCKLERSRQWAMRCLHEKKMYRDNCFVTLTYGNDFLPVGGTLVKRDLQLFMKRLRKKFGEGIRFYACGEYGELNMRPHYHILLFNFDFKDKVAIGQNRRGDKYYASADLTELWCQNGMMIGHSCCAEVTFESAAYVARYVLKKITGVGADAHYDVYDSDGVIHRRVPEFTIMSRRPGIGRLYYDTYGDEVRAHDNVVVNGRTVRPPRYYDIRTDAIDSERLAVLKSIRRKKAKLVASDNLVDRRRVKERLALLLLAKKERSL